MTTIDTEWRLRDWAKDLVREADKIAAEKKKAEAAANEAASPDALIDMAKRILVVPRFEHDTPPLPTKDTTDEQCVALQAEWDAYNAAVDEWQKRRSAAWSTWKRLLEATHIPLKEGKKEIGNLVLNSVQRQRTEPTTFRSAAWRISGSPTNVAHARNTLRGEALYEQEKERRQREEAQKIRDAERAMERAAALERQLEHERQLVAQQTRALNEARAPKQATTAQSETSESGNRIAMIEVE